MTARDVIAAEMARNPERVECFELAKVRDEIEARLRLLCPGDVVITMDVLGEPHRVGGLLKTLLDAMNTEPAQ